MRAIVVAIESGAKFVDKQRRFTLRFVQADQLYHELRIAEDKLPPSMRGVQLDYEVEVTLEPSRNLDRFCATCGSTNGGRNILPSGGACPNPMHIKWDQKSLPDAHLEGCSCPNCTDVREFEHKAGMSL